MKKKLSYLIIVLTLILTCPSTLKSGPFSDVLPEALSIKVAENMAELYVNNAPRSSDIFQKHLGVANPVQWGRKTPGIASANKLLNSAEWKNVKSDIKKHYGDNKQVQEYLDNQEYLFRKAAKTNNKASFRSVDIKGNLAESVMDEFYQKDNWEVINGKRGRTGIDGLYVRRNAGGRITTWLATEAKSGKSSLGDTKNGEQLSPEWMDKKLDELLEDDAKKISEAPDEKTKKHMRDIEQIKNMHAKGRGRKPRVFTMKIVTAVR